MSRFSLITLVLLNVATPASAAPWKKKQPVEPAPAPVAQPVSAPTPVPVVTPAPPACAPLKIVYVSAPGATDIAISVEPGGNTGMKPVINGQGGWQLTTEVDMDKKVTTVTAVHACYPLGRLDYSAHFGGIPEADYDCMGADTFKPYGTWSLFGPNNQPIVSQYGSNTVNGCEGQRKG